MTIVKAQLISKKHYPRDNDIIYFFVEKGLYTKTDEFKQFEKLEEETDELLEALHYKSKEDILSEAGDCYICLLNVLHCCGLTMEDAVDAAADKVTKRKGQVVDGVFVKEQP
jgi:NTP pyrophosphatase (non-canonical NTP hydrolase)